MNAEVAILLAKHKSNQLAENEFEETGYLEDATLEYAQRFAQYSDEGATRDVREHLNVIQQRHAHNAHNELKPQHLLIHDFEVASLANLCPATEHEARALIPTLTSAKISDNDLRILLQDLERYSQS